MEIDTKHFFSGLKLKNRFKQARIPFTTEQIRALLESKLLVNAQPLLKWFIWAASEVGTRPSELTGLLPEDIVLNGDIPHITIKDRKEKPLKTVQSERIIPLVGYSLDAFKRMPEGFGKYRNKPDSLTNAINKFLRENGLYPSPQHSLYSFRHWFQDRLLEANAPDRIPAELMGHKFNRPKYGDGGTLALKMQWLRKIEVKV